MIRFICLIGAGTFTVAGVYAIAGGNAYGWILALPFGPAYLLFVFQPRIEKFRDVRRKQEHARIWVKDDILVFVPRGELKQTFAVQDIEQITIFTGDQTALFSDLFWEIFAAGETITVPADAVGADTLLAAFQDLPGFDNQKAFEAFSSTQQDEFVLLSTKTAGAPTDA